MTEMQGVNWQNTVKKNARLAYNVFTNANKIWNTLSSVKVYVCQVFPTISSMQLINVMFLLIKGIKKWMGS